MKGELNGANQNQRKSWNPLSKKVFKKKTIHDDPAPGGGVEDSETVNSLKIKNSKKIRGGELDTYRKIPISAAETSKVTPITDPKMYQMVYERIFKDHVVTRSVKSGKIGFVFDGTAEMVDKLSKLPPCSIKKGLFVSKQECVESVDKPWASNDSIKAFNTFATEIDIAGMSIDDQVTMIKESGFPFSALYFSGSKSVHAISKIDGEFTENEYREISEVLHCVFPNCDWNVIENPNQFVRLPVINQFYNQFLIDFQGVIEKSRFVSWVKRCQRKIEDTQESNLSHTSPADEAQEKLAKFVDDNGGGTRFDCPICVRKARVCKGTLSIQDNGSGRLLFHCFRCALNESELNDLKQHFLKSQKKSTSTSKDKNYVLNSVDKFAQGILFHDAAQLAWFYKSDVNDYRLAPVEATKVKEMLYPAYRKACNEIGEREQDKSYGDIMRLVEMRNAVDVTANSMGIIPLNDGYEVDIRNNWRASKINGNRTYYLPISVEDLKNPPKTPLWNAFLMSHMNKEDIRLLKICIGYVLSNLNVKRHTLMLILHGDSDTGKSVILELLCSFIPVYATSASINKVIESPVLASSIIGKRLAVSGESTLKASKAEAVRSLISGEEVYVQILYKGRKMAKHNCVFVAATNEFGFVENLPENRKRVRVVGFANPVKEDDMDHDLLDKLKLESKGIIARSLLAFESYFDKRIPSSESTRRYMEESSRSANEVAEWLHTRRTRGGDIFNRTSDLLNVYRRESGDTFMKSNIFGKKMSKAIGEKFKSKSDHRGFLLNRKVE